MSRKMERTPGIFPRVILFFAPITPPSGFAFDGGFCFSKAVMPCSMPSIQVMRQVTHSVDGQEVCAVEYDREYLEKSWQWLRDEEIARLTLTPAFSRQQQAAWFDSLP